ncbi:hypothetical protein BDZ89DRAFT_1079707 [Hymenopellis radicata]|nr:hypothetical protein BDZ89DRAFT_1079707 [Hymenopellis radicata]
MSEDNDTIELITPGADQLFKEFNMSNLASTTKDWDAPQAGPKELILGGAAVALLLIVPVYVAFRWI